MSKKQTEHSRGYHITNQDDYDNLEKKEFIVEENRVIKTIEETQRKIQSLEITKQGQNGT